MRHVSYGSSCSNTDSDDEDSSSEDSSGSKDEDRHWKLSSWKKKKKHSHHKEDAKKLKRASRKTSQDGQEPNAGRNNVSSLAERFQQLELMLGQTANARDEAEVPCNLNTNAEPTNRHIAKLVERVAQDVLEGRNDTQLLLDQNQHRRTDYNREYGCLGHCYFCHLTNAHPRGSVNCLEAQAMVREGHCIFREGRVYMADRGEVPKVGPGENLAAVICSLGNHRRNNMAGTKATPSRPPQVSYVEAFEPEDSEPEDMGNESDMMAANLAMWQHVFVADRTKKPNPRFNPVDREKRVHWKSEQKEVHTASSKPMPYVDLPPPGQRSNMQRNLADTSSTRPPTTKPRKGGPEKVPDSRGMFEILKPTYMGDQKNLQRAKQDPPPVQDNPVVNLKAQPNIRKSDFIVCQDSQPNMSPPKILPKSPPKNRFTTTMRQQHTSGDIYHKVLGTGITLPLGELLAVCLEIEKTLFADTRLRTVPVTHARSGNYDEEMADTFANVSPCETWFEEINEEDDCSTYACGNSTQRPPDTSAAKNRSKGHPHKSDVISPTGSFIIKIGNHEVVAVVDSGAKMNMITPGLAEEFRNHFAEDETGKKYKMKNVSGVVSQLNGRFNDIPVGVGGHHLNTTFFVGDPWDSYFEAILGQTFLQSFACDLTWSDLDCNHIHMRIHPTGSRHDDAISMWLVKHGT